MNFFSSTFSGYLRYNRYNEKEKETKMLKEFKEFIMRGNAMEIAIGFIIGGAFGAIAKSIVADVFMPPICHFLGGVDFTNFFVLLRRSEPGPLPIHWLISQRQRAVTISFGVLLDPVISFLIVSLAVFILVKAMNGLNEQKTPAESNTQKVRPLFQRHLDLKPHDVPSAPRASYSG